MTSSSMIGTRRLAVDPRPVGLPVVPPVAPVVPVGPTPPAPRPTPAPVVPPISPGEMQIAVARFCLLTRGVGHRRDRRTDSRQPLRDRILIRGQGLRCWRVFVGSARYCRAEQKRHAHYPGGKDP